MESLAVVRTNFWQFLVLFIITSILGGLGAILLGIGVVLTFPFQLCVLTAAYRGVFGDEFGPVEQNFSDI